jgi:hypothetical protein
LDRLQTSAATSEHDDSRLLFDGQTLAGWREVPRVYGDLYPGGPSVVSWFAEQGFAPPAEPEKYPARWFAEDGYLVGEQSKRGYGGYLITEETFGDFELTLEARPDWPADTGIMLRRKRDTWEGFQVLLDHREHGGIGGFFGCGLASFSAVPFAVRSKRDAEGIVIGLEADDPANSSEPVTPDKIARLSHAATVEEFLAVWRWNDWNSFRIRCVGAMPVITTWINDLKIAEVDTATMIAPDYDPDAIHAVLGDRGHVALEVHDNDPLFGDARWAPGAQCRWRNIRIKEL